MLNVLVGCAVVVVLAACGAECGARSSAIRPRLVHAGIAFASGGHAIGSAGEPFDGYAFATTVDVRDGCRALIAAGILGQPLTLNGYDHWRILQIT